VRTVKPYSPAASSLTRPSIAEQFIVSEGFGDRLHWAHCEDLLFAVRPLRGGRFAYEGINQAFGALLGMSSGESLGLDISRCMGSEDSESVCEVFQACLAEGSEVRVQHSLTLGRFPAERRDDRRSDFRSGGRRHCPIDRLSPDAPEGVSRE
jgi:two-component system NarL family sensor kinase